MTNESYIILLSRLSLLFESSSRTIVGLLNSHFYSLSISLAKVSSPNLMTSVLNLLIGVITPAIASDTSHPPTSYTDFRSVIALFLYFLSFFPARL